MKPTGSCRELKRTEKQEFSGDKKTKQFKEEIKTKFLVG